MIVIAIITSTGVNPDQIPVSLLPRREGCENMPGIKGASDYSQETPCRPCLQINSKSQCVILLVLTLLIQEPFNAEQPRSALISFYVTPVDLFYKRNHGPIPVVDDRERFCVDITGLIQTPKKLCMRDVRMLPKYNVTAILQCAGNRRTAMSKTRKVRGVGWDVSAIGNAVWGGAKLADVLELAGIPNLTSSTQSGGKHVEFNCNSKIMIMYISMPLPLNRDHGYPLRIIVPGIIGARSVKWLDSINIIAEDSYGFFMQKDYKMFPPFVDWDNIYWSTRRPQMDFPVQSVICSLEDVQFIKPGKITIGGYAASGGGLGIERVDVSIDGGNIWLEASRFQKTGIPSISDHESSDKWAWVLFEITVDILYSTEIVVKAVDSAANVQPENVRDIWNLRGILNTSWHRVQVRVGHSNM
ncbi:sulfite oxidase-like [Hibiscus syriacus]|uniref:sulfite oxidase-like n=1 Tax=Hibiscus syriacus TaxID=106335 RepID=UPI0019222D71|nr:sulfite oxidase-like [Hibiscus syriacus]